MNLKLMCENAKKASREMPLITTQQKNDFLMNLSDALIENEKLILEANQLDCLNAEKSDLDPVLIERMRLDENKIKQIAKDLLSISLLPDPIGDILEDRVLENGLKLLKKRVPIGVIGVIYESRPNVTIDIAALAIKTGNVSILRGGKEVINTNRQLVAIIQNVLKTNNFPENSVNFIEELDRSILLDLLKMHQYIDMIIPRGGASLHEFCRENSSIPVITGGIGICHLYIDKSADQEKLLNVIVNAKTQRPTVCNALDTLLIHKDIAKVIIEKIIPILGNFDVTFKVDLKTRELLNQEFLTNYKIEMASEKDWHTEWLGLTLGIKVVENVDGAIEHIEKYGSGHSDGILSETEENVLKFFKNVDSAVLYHNASTRFTDGGEFGLGAEVAVSTQKLHARGPMGLKELTSYHWEVRGNYHVR